MTTDSIDFGVLPFGKLFRDYCANTYAIRDFFDYVPYDNQDLLRKANSLQFNTSRDELYDVLLEYNNTDFEEVRQNLVTLRDDSTSLAVVTGQQLTALGGPLFTLFKIVTAINTSRRYSQELGRKVIPVFWLADEDHDYPEIASVGLPVMGVEWNVHQLQDTSYIGKPVGSIPLDESIREFITTVSETLPKTDFTDDIIRLLESTYQPGSTHSQAFGAFIQHLFSEYGLLLAGSASLKAKELLCESIIEIVEHTGAVHEALESKSVELENEYHRQASVTSSNWFILDEEGYRKKLQFDKGIWSAGDRAYTTSEFIELISKEPYRLSPNVFIRPLLQDILLPNIAYVAGPGEIAYYAQMKRLYAVFGKTMPIVVPRLSATILEPSISKFQLELPFSIPDYADRVEDLHQRYVENEQSVDIQSFAEKWICQIEQLANEQTPIVENFDSTLVGTLVRVRQEQVNAINNLRQKMIKSEKNRLDIQLKRISKVQLALFPNMNLQERELAFIYALCKYGRSFIDDLVDTTQGFSSTSHLLIEV